MNTRPSNPNPNPNPNAPPPTSSNSFHRPAPPTTTTTTTTQASYSHHEGFFNGIPPSPQLGNMPPQMNPTPGAYTGGGGGGGGSPIAPGAGGYGTPTGSHLLGSPLQSVPTPRVGRPLLPTSSNSTGGPPAIVSHPSIATSPFSTIPTIAPTPIPTASTSTPTPTSNPNPIREQPAPRTRGPGKNSRASAAAAASAAASHSLPPPSPPPPPPPPTNTNTNTTTTTAIHHHFLEEEYTAFADMLDTLTFRQLAIQRFAKNHDYLHEVFGPRFEREGVRSRKRGEGEDERRLGCESQVQVHVQQQLQQQRERERERRGTPYDGQMMNLGPPPPPSTGTNWITWFAHPGAGVGGLSLEERRSALESLRDASRHEMKEMESRYEILSKQIQFTPT